ncbi:hypothetical protein AAVH_34698, partial [Aphelenchoides avenae]
FWTRIDGNDELAIALAKRVVEAYNKEHAKTHLYILINVLNAESQAVDGVGVKRRVTVLIARSNCTINELNASRPNCTRCVQAQTAPLGLRIVTGMLTSKQDGTDELTLSTDMERTRNELTALVKNLQAAAEQTYTLLEDLEELSRWNLELADSFVAEQGKAKGCYAERAKKNLLFADIKRLVQDAVTAELAKH